MTVRTEPIDGGLEVDPAVAWVMLAYREAVAEATFTALRALRSLGVGTDVASVALVDRSWRNLRATRQPRRRRRSR